MDYSQTQSVPVMTTTPLEVNNSTSQSTSTKQGPPITADEYHVMLLDKRNTILMEIIEGQANLLKKYTELDKNSNERDILLKKVISVTTSKNTSKNTPKEREDNIMHQL